MTLFGLFVATALQGRQPALPRRAVGSGAALAAASCWGLPAFAADIRDAAPGPKLTNAQVEAKLRKTTVCALVNPDDAPYLNGGVGYFYLDPKDALLELRVLQKNSPEAQLKVVSLAEVYFPLVMGEQGNLGGELRLRPSRRQVVLANRAMSTQPQNGLMPTTLDEAKGQVPVFYSERVSLVDKAGAASYPFFLAKEDLDAAFVELQKPGGGAAPDDVPKSAREQRREAEAEGMPDGLVRIATLDGLVRQMKSGEIDLSQAVLVGSSASVALAQKLVQ